MVVKMSNSVQAMFMLGPKTLSIYDPQLKYGLGYKNPYTLKQAVSANPKLYDASYLYSLNVRANVRNTAEILEDATKKTSTSTVTPTIASKVSSPPLTMPKSSKMIKYFHTLEKEINKLYTLLEAKTATKSILFKGREDITLSQFYYDDVKPILYYLHMIFKAIQKEFPEDVCEMVNVFYSMESDLSETLRQNEILKDRLLEATLNYDVERCALMCSDSMNDKLNDEIEKFKRESINV
ncbi:hypothetical protein Tco_1424882 [Tanacetum coccineum]